MLSRLTAAASLATLALAASPVWAADVLVRRQADFAAAVRPAQPGAPRTQAHGAW